MDARYTKYDAIRWGLYVMAAAIDWPASVWPAEAISAYLAEVYPEGSADEHVKLVDDVQHIFGHFPMDNLAKLLEQDPDLAATTLSHLLRLRPCGNWRNLLLNYELMGRAFGYGEIARKARFGFDRENSGALRPV